MDKKAIPMVDSPKYYFYFIILAKHVLLKIRKLYLIFAQQIRCRIKA